LHYAANRGLLAVTRLLIEHGAELDVQDERGCTPLMLTAPDHADLINLLLLSGARTDLRDDDGYTAVEHALAQADGFSRMGRDEIERVEAERRKAKLIKQFQGRRKRR
jgi:ankyrin repeat protein